MRKGTKRKAQNTAPESAEENSTNPARNNSASAGEISKGESSENPEKMDPDNAEPSKEAADKEVDEVKTKKAAKQQKGAARPKEEQECFEKTRNLKACITVANAEPNKEAADKEIKEVETRKTVKRPNRAAKPKEEQDYFKETLNLEDLWKQTFPVGTEWELLDNIYQYNWSFRNLEEAFEKGDEKRDREESEKKKGILAGKKVYLFGCTEPQLLSCQDKLQIVIVPVVVAVVSPFPPSDKLGITSVQREQEEIVPMKRMKMDWVPYIPVENRLSQVERLKSNIYILSCTQRRAGLKHLREDRVRKFTYCLPYIYQPFKEKETEEDTEVTILYPDTEPPIVSSFDWKFDELEEFTDKWIGEDMLPPDKKEVFKEFVKEKVREAKKANREGKEVRKKALEEMCEETKTVLKNMKLYKFYPVPTADSPDIFKSPYINRYYGNADEIF